MKDVKLIMISGKQGSGKTTLCDSLEEALGACGRGKFAKPLYEMHDQVLKVLNKYTNGNRTLDKRLLQLLGTEWGRDHIDQNIWVKCLQTQVQMFKDNKYEYVLVDDLRFKNEFEGYDCIKIRLECPEEIRKARCSQWRDTSNHISETDLDDYVDKFDLIIHTDIITEAETLRMALDHIQFSQKAGH